MRVLPFTWRARHRMRDLVRFALTLTVILARGIAAARPWFAPGQVNYGLGGDFEALGLGEVGWVIPDVQSSLPSGTTVTSDDATSFVYRLTNDTRWVTVPGNTTKVTGLWYNAGQSFFSVRVQTAAPCLDIHFYSVDLDTNQRRQRITQRSTGTGIEFSDDFSLGAYATIRQDVSDDTYTFEFFGGANAVVSAIVLDTCAARKPPSSLSTTISIQPPPITATASISASLGLLATSRRYASTSLDRELKSTASMSATLRPIVRALRPQSSSFTREAMLVRRSLPSVTPSSSFPASATTSTNATPTTTASTVPPPTSAESRPADPRVRALGISPSTAATLVSISYSSSAVAAMLSPTMGSKATSAGRVANVAECGIYDPLRADESEEDWPDPVAFLWLIFPLGTGGGEGNGVSATEADALAHGVGAALLSAAVNLTFVALLLLATTLRKRAAATGRLSRGVAVLETAVVAGYTVSITYLGPSVTSVAVTLLRFAGYGGRAALAVAGVVSIIACTLAAAPLVRLLTATRAFVTPRIGSDSSPASGADTSWLGVWKRILASTWEGVRDVTRTAHRWCLLEDLTVAHSIAALDGVRPTSATGCRVVSATTAVVATAHVMYVAVVRPFESSVEWIGMLTLSLMQLAMAAVAGAVVVAASWSEAGGRSDDSPDSALDFALAVLQLGYDAAVFGLLGLLAVAECRTSLRTSNTCTGTDDDRTGDSPLLSMPQGPTALDDDGAAEGRHHRARPKRDVEQQQPQHTQNPLDAQ